MPKVALISDIHSNVEALEAVLKDIADQKVSDIVCLGDIIGYGPNPREVLKRALDWRWCLRGNHEEALLFQPYDFNPDAAKAIDWTRTVLNNSQYPKNENHFMWNFLAELPDVKEESEILYLHASPRHHTKEYVMPYDVQNEEMMEEIFSEIKWLCFGGHTHIPGIFTDELQFYFPKTFNYRFQLPKGKKFMVNIGSVGQPRDRDTRASYVIFDIDNSVIDFRRIEYNFQKTMERIRSIPAIPVRFAERLEVGK